MTKAELVSLLKAKKDAHEHYDFLLGGKMKASFSSPEEEVDYDLNLQVALSETVKTENAYRDALLRHTAEQNTDTEGRPF